MRRGRDWRVAGLLLIGQSYLPVSETTFRSLLEFMFEDLDTAEDPLGQADEAINRSSESPLFKRLVRLLRDNISSAQLVDPVTKEEISAESVAPGIMAQIWLAMLGDILPEGAVEEIAAAMGLIKLALPQEECFERINYVGLFSQALLGTRSFRKRK